MNGHESNHANNIRANFFFSPTAFIEKKCGFLRCLHPCISPIKSCLKEEINVSSLSSMAIHIIVKDDILKLDLILSL